MSTRVLFNLLNELRKSDKMLSLPSILSLFSKEFNNFYNTGARMLDYIYLMTPKIYCKSRLFLRETLIFCHIYATLLHVRT